MQNVQRGRTGWKDEEEALLFAEIENSESSGRSLKAVFEAVAEKTGRRPNSIRNYYYARIKEKDLSTTALHAGAFVPFGEEEIRALLRTVLSAQANGISVRACTMSMGGGDNKAMLRYQNKYRALLKNRPQLVRQVAAELKSEGVEFDPFESMRKNNGGTKKRESLMRAACNAAQRLDAVEGVDAAMFIEGLGKLAQLAASPKGKETTGDQHAVSELRERVRRQEAELEAQQDRFHALLMMYRRLVRVSREFLGMAAPQQVRAPEYAVFAHSVADCEQALSEYNA